MQGPKTNLRVAAILEKANAIRQVYLSTSLRPTRACFFLIEMELIWNLLKQAFAGSDDEDDDSDSWSDSD